MEVMFDRVAGLDVGKDVGDGVRPHARPARWAAQRDAHVQDDVRLAAGDAGLAGRGRGDASRRWSRPRRIGSRPSTAWKR